MKRTYLKNNLPERKHLLLLKGVLFFFFLNLATNHAFAQENNSNKNWTFDKTVSNVDFYHMITICGRNKVVFLKFNNKNSSAVTVSWKEIFTTKQVNSEKTEGPFRGKQLLIQPGETLLSGCDDTKNYQLLARPDQSTPVYHAEILKFNFQDIKVSN